MAPHSEFSVLEKQRIVLSVLHGEASVAETARRNKCSQTVVAKWRDQFVPGRGQGIGGPGAAGSVGARCAAGTGARRVMAALGVAHVRLRLAEEDGAAGFASRSST